ncbi:MAG: Gp37 family protein [Alphaproteobacteria bacterium]|nr:Gp37 family protein [Alphaproteobacteria bacterium]
MIAIAIREAQLKSYLGSVITAVPVVDFPEQPESFQLKNEKGALTIRLQAVEYKDTVNHTVTYQFALSLLYRWLRGDEPAAPAYAILEQLRTALSGVALSVDALLHLDSIRFDGRKNGLWKWAITVSCRTYEVAEPSVGSELESVHIGFAPNIGPDHKDSYESVIGQ